MNRIKVINEPSELVPMLRSVDTPVKRDVLKEVTLEWRTADEIEEKFGPEGRDAIIFFEKMKQEIMDKIPATGFPAHLDLQDQGRFFIGYYHQKQEFFTKTEEENKD